MLKRALKRLLHPVRLAARRFLLLPPPGEGSYTGTHGCLYTAASFTTWNQVEGDYLEFGVYRGDSFATAYRAIRRQREKHAGMGYRGEEYERWRARRPRFFAFDSFEGLPAGEARRHVDYDAGGYACSEEEFRRNLVAEGVDLDDVVVVKGFYDRTLHPGTKAATGLRRAAIAMIDCDLYESTVPVLDFLTDLVDQGSILIFHDWFRFKGSPNCGEQRACREWLARNPQLELVEYWREGPQAVSYLVNLR